MYQHIKTRQVNPCLTGKSSKIVNEKEKEKKKGEKVHRRKMNSSCYFSFQ